MVDETNDREMEGRHGLTDASNSENDVERRHTADGHERNHAHENCNRPLGREEESGDGTEESVMQEADDATADANNAGEREEVEKNQEREELTEEREEQMEEEEHDKEEEINHSRQHQAATETTDKVQIDGKADTHVQVEVSPTQVGNNGSLDKEAKTIENKEYAQMIKRQYDEAVERLSPRQATTKQTSPRRHSIAVTDALSASSNSTERNSAEKGEKEAKRFGGERSEEERRGTRKRQERHSLPAGT